MGVDIDTYRGRIGTFSYQFGLGVITLTCIVNFSRGLKCVGSVIFIGSLLIIAGIEQNPGPNGKEEMAVPQKVLRKALPKLVESLDLKLILDNFLSNSIIPPTRARDIKEERTTSDGIRTLISEIEKRGTETYKAFITSLEETNQENLASYLHDIENEINHDKGAVSSTKKLGQTDSDSDDDIFYDAKGGIADSGKNPEIERILQTLGLKSERKIKISDAIKIESSQSASRTYRDIPIEFLKRLLAGNSDVMDYRSYLTIKKMNTKVKGSVLAMYQPKNSGNISPLDLFLLVFQRCDPMLKQLLFQKLYMCKIAFPFLYKEYPSPKSIMTLWPLRSIVIDNFHKSNDTVNSLKEFELLELPINVVSFARFGRPNFSKSKLLNGLLCDKGSETFFHKDRPLGMSTRYSVGGYVEMFILPVVTGANSEFNHPVMFLNLRGDLNTDFEEDVIDFISVISDVVTIVVETDYLRKYKTALESITTHFSSVILICSGQLGPQDGETFKTLGEVERTILNRDNTTLQLIATHDTNNEKNYPDVIMETREEIASALRNESVVVKSLQDRLQGISIETDENKSCKDAECSAKDILDSLDHISTPERWIENVTPIQNTSSKLLGAMMKECYRNKDLNSLDVIKTQMSKLRSDSLRKGQESIITEPVNLFCHSLMQHKNDVLHLQYFLQWIKILLDSRKRTHNRNDFDSEQELDTTNCLKDTDTAYHEVDHFFREIGHICDSAICLNISHDDIGFPPFRDLATVIANLVSNGYTFELLDGNSFYMSTEWIKLVLGLVHGIINHKSVLTLSVLGIQSSGKSTLLNSMFGLQFPTSSGRCTRGIHMQLIPISKSWSLYRSKPFEYVLVIDTEGVRAPELFDIHETGCRRDNELSMIITGLGDITMMNVMGESTSELREILQILAHAFLRLKLANNRLDIRKSCFFIHQNVSDMRAYEKMESGLQQSVKNLDKATKESADYEGISDITTFNQVIEFDPKSNVWYLPNYWQGYQPMASVNQKYCSKIMELNNHLIKKWMDDQNKSFKTLEDTYLHIDDLWKGVLAEDFVFSFRNSIEKKAYIGYERKMKEELWSFESSFDDHIFPLAQNNFNQCDNVTTLGRAKEKTIIEMKKKVEKLRSKTKENMEIFFAENKYKDTTIKWKEFSVNRIHIVCEEVFDNRKSEIDRMSKKRQVDIMISVTCEKHEEELRRKSLEVAKELRPSGAVINQAEANKRFEEIWKNFMEESLSADISNSEPEGVLREDFISCLTEIYDSHTTILFSTIKEYDDLEKNLDIEILAGSLDRTGLTESDLSLSFSFSKIKKKIKSKLKYLVVKDNLEHVFIMVDDIVKQNCRKKREITKRDVKQFLNEVSNLINSIQKQNSVTLKTTGVLKLVVYISCYSYSRFKKENFVHQQSQGIKVRLEIYKKHVHERFIAHLKQRNTEETAAILMRGAIEEYLRVVVSERLTMVVKRELKSSLPILKYHLLLEILTELAVMESNEDSFRIFMRYILAPKQYAYNWLSAKSESTLFSGNSKLFLKNAEIIIFECLNDVKKTLSESIKNFPEYTPSIDEWIQNFRSLSAVTFPKECFRHVVRELEGTERVHLPDFKNKIIEELCKSFSTLLNEFKSTTEDTVKWSTFNPIEDICKEVWGCPEQCLFCGEPCIKGCLHEEESSHICLQHRPLGCSGAFDEKTGEILLNSCNVNIVSTAAAPCSMIDFICNPKRREPCKEGWHKFADYKTIAPGWDIEPTRNIDDRSKFWMWFIGNHAEELGKYHNLNVKNVPKRWTYFSKEEALISLRNLYGMSD